VNIAYASSLIATDAQKENPMPKPNYSYEKRQRELAKKKKKEEKRLQKLRVKEEAAKNQQSNVSDEGPVDLNN